jgi:hypothetical protein
MDSELIKKFFNDPDWVHVEERLRGYIEPLVDMNKVDFSQDPTEFKAELRAKFALYKAIDKFLLDSKVLSRPLKDIKNPFK